MNMFMTFLTPLIWTWFNIGLAFGQGYGRVPYMRASHQFRAHFQLLYLQVHLEKNITDWKDLNF